MCAQLQPILCTPVDCSPPGSSVHGDFPGKNTGVGCHALLQGIFPTQGWNPCLLHLPALSGRFFITEPAGSPKQEYTAYQRNICPMRLDSRSQLTCPGMGGSKPLNVSSSQMGRPHHCSIEPLVVLTTAWLCFIKESPWPLSGLKFLIFQQPPLERTIPKFQFGEC